MAIKVAGTLEPNGSFPISYASDIVVQNADSTTTPLVEYIDNNAGTPGPQGEKGDKGDTGAAFTYDMFTEEQLASLKGEKGDKGDTGAQGVQGVQGVKGEKGDKGEAGANGANGQDAHIAQDLTEDDDGTKHLYIRTWEGEDEAAAITSPDLMLQVNDLADECANNTSVIDTLISKVNTVESTAKNNIDTALATAKSYTDTQIVSIVGGAPEDLDTLRELADAHTANVASIETLNTRVTSVEDALKSHTETALDTAKSYTDTQIANLVNGAPEQLDTLKELSDAYTNNATLIEALTEAVTNHKHDIATTESDGFMSASMVTTLNNHSTGITFLDDALTSLDRQVQGFSNDISDNAAGITALKTRCTSLEERCTTLESVLTYFMPSTYSAGYDESVSS